MFTTWQPFGTLIAEGIKDRETRSWRPPQALIGQRIGIHAGRRMVDQWALDQATVDALVERFGGDYEQTLPRGAIVATAVLSGCGETTGKALDPHGDYSAGRWWWKLDDVYQLYTPIPVAGRQGIWTYEPDPELCPVHLDHYAADHCGRDL